MKKNKSRVHVFRGQDIAEFILNHWFRGKTRPENDPIEQLVRLEFARSREFMPLYDDENQAAKIVNLVNSTVARWNPGQRRAASQSVRNDWKVTYLPVETSPEPMGMLVLDKCLLLKEQGLLDRIRQCARPGCGEWFFAKFDHQIAHADACRIAMLAVDEKRKEKRREYMRDLRALKKRKKFRSLGNKGRKP